MDLKEQILHYKAQNSEITKETSLEFQKFEDLGFPSTQNEEWKYTSVKEIVSKKYAIAQKTTNNQFDLSQIAIYSPNDYCIVFINGHFTQDISNINPTLFEVFSYKSPEYLDKKNKFGHYQSYNKDGFVALNEAFIENGIFIKINKNSVVDKPIYIYYINDCKAENTLSLPHLSILVEENAEATFIEFFTKTGENISLTNIITEITTEENTTTKYYKILHEGSDANHIGTTQINQNGKSVTNATTIVLSGNIVRNNLNISLNKSYSEANLFGLSLLSHTSHVDNHTVVDHAVPHCESSELYKAILDEKSSSVFNGKIFVRKDAQKTNAYQSSKNILLSNEATAYSKPQLEIWADDVKCSHGHATGQLNKDHVFYLKARGISETMAIRMLTQAYAQDILNNITLDTLKNYCESEIEKRFNA